MLFTAEGADFTVANQHCQVLFYFWSRFHVVKSKRKVAGASEIGVISDKLGLFEVLLDKLR
jgi:hypothetical protein